MRVGFIYTLDDYARIDKPLRAATDISFGISCVAAMLKKNGHNVNILVITRDTPLQEALEKFHNEFQPDMFGITAVASEYAFVVKVARKIKSLWPSKHIILGGHHASLSTDICLQEPSFDFICVGEGDQAMAELVSQLESGTTPKGIPNLCIRLPDGSIDKSPTSNFIANLSDLPFPEREMWHKWIALPDERPSVLISRGCPYKCTYCANHAMAKLAPGKYVRYRSPEHIVAEIRKIILDQPNVEDIYLEAETFGADLRYTFPICEALAELNATLIKPLRFSANFTLIKLISSNTKLLEALQKANFTNVNIGLETGCERLRNGNLERPPYKNEDLIEFVKKAKEYDIDVTFFVLMGLPTESLTDFKETLRVVREAQPIHVFLSIFYPYPGTKLHKIAEDLGLINKNPQYGYERTKVNLDLPEFNSKQIMREYVWFFYNVYKGKKPLLQVLARTFVTYLSTKPMLFKFYRKLGDKKFFLYLKTQLKFKATSKCSRKILDHFLDQNKMGSGIITVQISKN